MHRYWWRCSSSSSRRRRRRRRDRLVNIPRPISRCTSVQRSPNESRQGATSTKSRDTVLGYFSPRPDLNPTREKSFPSILDEFLRLPFLSEDEFSLPFHLLSPLSSIVEKSNSEGRWILIGVGDGTKEITRVKRSRVRSC